MIDRLFVGFFGLGLLASACGGAGATGGEEGGEDAAGGGELSPVFEEPGAFTALPERPRATASGAFWEWWGDGRAELSGYRITTTRYGESREGELVLIYVTEPHDRRVWIKDDDVPEPHRVEVLKLITSLRFLTGIYPYSVTSSVFSPVDDFGGERFRPVKATLTAHEWCGSWFLGVWPGPDRFRVLRLSYFASEGERKGVVEADPGVLYEDALLIQLRELDGPFAGGGDWEGDLVPGLWEMRRGHGEPRAVPARIARHAASRAGVPVTRFVLRYGERVRTVDVEREPPRRVLGWTVSRGGSEVERAELLATERLAYWTLNAPGDERWRGALGLDTAAYTPPRR